MKLTTPYAVLAGFALVALAIASQPFTGSLVPAAWAQIERPIKVQICDDTGLWCAQTYDEAGFTVLPAMTIRGNPSEGMFH